MSFTKGIDFDFVSKYMFWGARIQNFRVFFLIIFQENLLFEVFFLILGAKLRPENGNEGLCKIKNKKRLL